ncbi:class I SAM-dependent methyltransferase [Reyranella sp.]|uniref:class I SAM-dependent methyltransferase n=1 Tax=Reyranella sp. TaxID=1929291 RepID=UPI003D142C1C
MSRLDSFIARMQAQRDCLNFLKPAVDALPGPILEVGLGNGRTYDHLRDLFPGRDIHVFERKVAAHPDCIPPADRLFLGEARDTLRLAAQQLGPTAALIHTDLGTGDHAANMAMGEWLGLALDALAASGGWILANQALDVARWQRQPEPPGVPKDRYFLYRVG